MPPHTRAIARDVRRISTAFKDLARTFDRLGPILQAAQIAPAPTRANGKATPNADGERARKRPTLMPAFRRQLKLQGQYMGTMRGLKPRQQAQVKRVRAEKGIRAAIREARRMAQ